MKLLSLTRETGGVSGGRRPPGTKEGGGLREAQVVGGTPPLGACSRGGDDSTPRVGTVPSLKSLSLGSPGTSTSKAERTPKLR